MSSIEDLTAQYILLDMAIKSDGRLYMPKEYVKLSIMDENGNNLGKLKKIVRHKDHAKNFLVLDKKLISLNRTKDLFDQEINISYRELEQGYKFV